MKTIKDKFQDPNQKIKNKPHKSENELEKENERKKQQRIEEQNLGIYGLDVIME